METVQFREETDWRVLVFARNGSELLLLNSPSGLCLPTLRIPLRQRIAPHLNDQAKRSWNLDTVCLVPLEISGASNPPHYHIMEARDSEELARIATKCLDASALDESSFSDRCDYLAVRRALNLGGSTTPKDSADPFSRFEWFGEIAEWVEEQLEPLGIRWEGTFRQLQAGPSFALIRFQTNRGAGWFKATGEPNRRELPVTRTLSSLFPERLPKLLAVREDWNAWLMDEVPGRDLFSSGDPVCWCAAAESFARLQIESMQHTSIVLASGARDARTARLLPMVRPFCTAIAALMDEQQPSRARRLTPQEIQTIEQHVRGALLELETMSLPDTLNHFDLNPGNAFVEGKHCKFLDWAEAAVGKPFFSFEYLRQHFLRAFGERQDSEAAFRNSYRQVWRSLLPDRTLERMFTLSPLTAAFAFAAVLPWQDPQLRSKAELAPFLRSLARRIDREVKRLRCRPD